MYFHQTIIHIFVYFVETRNFVHTMELHIKTLLDKLPSLNLVVLGKNTKRNKFVYHKISFSTFHLYQVI